MEADPRSGAGPDQVQPAGVGRNHFPSPGDSGGRGGIGGRCVGLGGGENNPRQRPQHSDQDAQPEKAREGHEASFQTQR